MFVITPLRNAVPYTFTLQSKEETSLATPLGMHSYWILIKKNRYSTSAKSKDAERSVTFHFRCRRSLQFSWSVANPYTSSTRISKSPLGQRGGLLNVWQWSVLPKRMFSSNQMACPSLQIEKGWEMSKKKAQCKIILIKLVLIVNCKCKVKFSLKFVTH